MREDIDKYITYVFENIDSKNYLDKYIMCTQFPNWDSPKLHIGELGFVEIEEHIAGKDKWFDGTNFIPYKYTGVQFIKFIPIKPNVLDEKIIL